MQVYAFLTTTPDELVATIDYRRMTVLLMREEEFAAWLRGSQPQMPPVQEGVKKQDLLEAA